MKELKLASQISLDGVTFFNRTIVELKLPFGGSLLYLFKTFNRTIVELKRDFVAFVVHAVRF